MWLNRLPCQCLSTEHHPNQFLREYVTLMERRGIEIHLLRLPTDNPCTVMAALSIDRSGSGPAAVLGMGADLEPTNAAFKAMIELGQLRPAIIHDWLTDNLADLEEWSWSEAADLFSASLKSEGVGWYTRGKMLVAVRAWGIVR